eukprot:TRINITY_DN249_c1_g1_i1.p1 TRINITY_DN249_c1_g1~~TRINITY_DN249_c1_g1_i1.p1  ORF type:complete len:221 (+),score=38.90 TRINITY_DN249_c1_g1_i1:227-889(+)
MYMNEVKSRVGKRHWLHQLTESFDCSGYQNIEKHTVGYAIRGESIELDRALSELPDLRLAFAKQEYLHWAYHGNYSGIFPAVIYRSIDESPTRFQDENFDDEEDDYEDNNDDGDDGDGDEYRKRRKKIFPCDFYYPTEGLRCYEDGDSREHETRKGNLFHWACLGGHVDCVKLLLDKYSEYFDIDEVVTEYGATGLDIARTNSYWEIVKLILNFKTKQKN